MIGSFAEADVYLEEIRAWENEDSYLVGEGEDPRDPIVQCECPACWPYVNGEGQLILPNDRDWIAHKDFYIDWQVDQYFAGVEAMYSAMLEEKERESGYGEWECAHGIPGGDCNVCGQD